MPANTPILSLPYPIPADSVDVPRDIQALATALDTTLGAGGSVYAAKPVLDVGLLNQIRAGRQLAVADFTAMGLSTPVGLFNLSGLTNLGSGGALVNKGTVPFGVGVNGLASTAAQFAGSTAQALYIADTGAADPFRIRTGSFGCWFRTAKRGTEQVLFSKWRGTGNQRSWWLEVATGNYVAMLPSIDGIAVGTGPYGVSDVADDRWHFAVVTVDGTAQRLYVDGVLESSVALSSPLFAGSGPLNIGSSEADASIAATLPFYGRVDEAFVTPDVLTEDEIRLLYCVKVAHGLPAAPTKTSLNVRRQRRGGPLVVGDFPASPIRLHNFTGGALTDAGTGGVPLVHSGAGTAVAVAGADGAAGNGLSVASADFKATDAGLPSGTASRSYGLWVKTASAAAAYVMTWGAVNGTSDVRLNYNADGTINCGNGADNIGGGYIGDGRWHQLIVVEDNAAGDGCRRKFYIDGRLVGSSTVLTAITLGGADRFRVGASVTGTAPFTGQLDGVFVTGSALTFEQVAALYSKGSQALAASPKNAGDHVEAIDSTSVLATFDTLDSQYTVDLGVS